MNRKRIPQGFTLNQIMAVEADRAGLNPRSSCILQNRNTTSRALPLYTIPIADEFQPRS